MGCSSCLNTSIYFFKNNHSEHDNIFYLFSNVNAAKSLRLKIGGDLINSASDIIILDNNTLFNSHLFNANYPTIIKFEKGLISSLKESNPSSTYDDLMDLKTFCKK